MEPPDLSKYCYTSTKIPVYNVDSVYNMTYEELCRESLILRTDRDLVVALIEEVEELRKQIAYHNVLVILHFAHSHETLFKEMLQREWSVIKINKISLAENYLNSLAIARLQSDANLRVDTCEIRELIRQIALLNTETLDKDHKLWKLVVRLEN